MLVAEYAVETASYLTEEFLESLTITDVRLYDKMKPRTKIFVQTQISLSSDGKILYARYYTNRDP